jgi:hypothetical protein
MRDLDSNELVSVYGAGGRGKKCAPPKKSKKCKGGSGSGSKRGRSGSRRGKGSS